jgi:DinB superfamily
MKRRLPLLLLLLPLAALAQDKKNPTDLRGVLLQQLRTTHSEANWFVPAKTAVDGLTAEQASWSPGKGEHSAGQLAYHLWFWDARALSDFKGEKKSEFSGKNDETFDNFTAAQWDELVKKLDQVMTDWEKAVEAADEKTLAEKASTIAVIGAHNAYHVGQIIYVRKLQGSWNPDKGVK